MSENNKDIALKAWEIHQNLAKGMGESAWKIRSIYFTTSAALFAYSYNSSTPALYLLIPVMSILFLILESGYRRLQDQYIEKSIQIEKTINDFVANEEQPEFPDSLGTDVDTPSFKQLIGLFKIKRIIFWMPYFVIFITPVIFFLFGVKK